MIVNFLLYSIHSAVCGYGGCTARNFSCYAFESYNGVLGRMRKTTRKRGALEDSLMRIASMRAAVDRELKTAAPDWMRQELERLSKGTNKRIGQITGTNMAKTTLDDTTRRLLLELLNGPHKSIQGMYKSSMDPTLGADDVGITQTAQHFHSLVKEWFPAPIRYSSARQGGSVNIGNTFVMVPLDSESSLVAQVLWLFKKRIRFHTEQDDGEELYFAHIRQIEVVEAAVALGTNHPCLALLDEIGVMFGRPGGHGRELVVPFNAIRFQLSVCTFQSLNGTFWGLKTV